MDNSTFGATQKTRISLASAVTSGTRSYQKIVLTVTANATSTNTVYLTIDSQTYSFILDSGCLGSNTVARLREFFRRALDTTFVIKSNGSDIIMYNVYGATVQNISFNGNGTGITMSISKTTESGSICTQTAGAIATNSIIEVNSIYNFGGGTLTIPADCTLSFNNGCILNARLRYDNTLIDGDYNILNCICSGKLANAEVYPEMFGALTSNFRKDKYDLSVAIQNALDGGNMNIVIDSKKVTKDGNHYEWRHTVSLFVPSSSAPTSDDNLWSLSIRGNAGAPMTSVGPIAKRHQILVLTETVFLCGGHNFSFNYSNKLWPSVHLSNLSFRFQNDLEDTIFFDGVLAGSVIDGVNVYACDKFVNGGLKKTSLVANCRIEAQKYVFGGYMIDSKVENCYFTGIRKHTDTEPVFYMNSILYGSNRVTGGHWATVYSNNYIDYFPTIFVINSSCKDIISTSGNTFDIFKYFARSLYWEGTVLKDGSKTRGCRICSNGDVLMRCNNLAAGEDDATDNYLTLEASKDALRFRCFLPDGAEIDDVTVKK